jgi:iron complex outermembrane recepter protein
MSHHLLSCAVVALIATQSAAAAAAEADPELEDIVVTADREGFGAGLVQVGTFRGARIIDVPLTVNVVPDAVLKAQAVTGLYEALRNTAGVTRSQLNGATYDNIAIRGILVENRTSYRLNGSLPTINLVDLPLENKDRVEVLKGVGAIYYGFAPPSGIINLVSKRADRDIVAAEAGVNSDGGARIAVDIGQRWGGFGLRFNGSAGIVETGIDRFDGDRYVAALAADLEIASGLTARFDVEHVAKDVTEPAAIVLPAAVGGVITLPPVPDNSINLGGKGLRYAAFATNVLGRIDWRIADGVALTIEGGQALTVRDRDFSQFQNYSLATGDGVLQVFSVRDQRYRNRTVRAELAARFDTGPLRHNVIAGVTSQWRFQNGRANQISPATVATPTAIRQNLFTPRDVALPTLTGVNGVAPLNIRDTGAYVTNRVEIGPVQLLGGARYTAYRSASTNAAGVTTRFALNRWTPSVGLIVKPTADTSVYATYLEGLEEGGFAPANTVNANEVLPPAVSRQYEVGVKAEFARGLVAQVAAFQVDRPSAFTDPADNRFKLAGQARYRGVEASLTGAVTDTLSVYASAQYLNARTRRAVNPLAEGKRPENTPEWTASLFAEQKIGAVSLGAGAFYLAKRAVNGLNQAFIPGYVLFSASARWQLSETLELQANVENIADRNYWSATGNGLVGTGIPRQARLTARVRL